MAMGRILLGFVFSVGCAQAGAAAEANEPETVGASALPDLPRTEPVRVIARFRDENLQDVPIGISVLTAARLRDAGVDRPGDFVAMAPNVSLVEAQSAGYSALTIRGVSQVRNGEPPVAMVVDGVLQVHPAQFTRELLELERVEILRGPQGALYGRNASGGAILLSTRAPAATLGGHWRLGIGSDGERLQQASLSGPVGAAFGFRVGARQHAHDGYFDNTTLGRRADPYHDRSLRSLLRWSAGDTVSTDLRLNLSRTRGGALNYRFQPANLAADGVSLDLADPFDFSRADADSVDRRLLANNLGENDRDIDELSLKFEFASGGVGFTSISALTRVEEYVAGDQFPYTALALPASQFFIDGTQTQFVDVQAFSQELRLMSAPEPRVRWMVGAWYLHTSRFVSTSTGDDRGLGIERITRRPAFDSLRNPTATFLADDNRNRAFALFGNVVVDLGDSVELALALRHDVDRREQRVSPLQVGGGDPGARNRSRFERLQPKLTASWRPSLPMLLYASWGEGFRSGQFNQNGVGAAAAGAGLQGVDDRIAAETSRTFELGAKSALFDDRWRLNLALFDSRLEHTPYFVFVGAIAAQVLVGIDRVRVRGGELEAEWRPVEGFEIHAGVGVSDSRVLRYRLNEAAVGRRAPYVPAISANLGLQYRRAIGAGHAGFVRLDYEHRGRQYWDPENSSARSALDLLHLRVGIESTRQPWSLVASVRNATDQRYNAEWVAGGFAQAAPPRRWQLELRREF